VVWSQPYSSRPPARAAKGSICGDEGSSVSDLSGREAEDEGQFGRLVVQEHPDTAKPATLEVFPQEVADLRSAERLPVWGAQGSAANRHRRPVQLASQGRGHAYSAGPGDHDRTRAPRGEGAQPARRQRRGAGGSGRGKVNYATLEHAGEPHRGRITEARRSWFETT
jgi:hypothetical protein